jgi:NADH dehydrogenase
MARRRDMAKSAGGAVTTGPEVTAERPVVVIGAGFAGLEVAKYLGRAGVHVVLIDRQNHHLFQPLLYQVATAALSATDIAEPVRKILRRYSSIRVMLAEVTGIDTGGHEVELSDGMRVAYSKLVIAGGALPGYFGHDEWARFAPGLKTNDDARRVRSRVLSTFEDAERVTDPAEQKRLMSFYVVGGGPTGVELAGALAELSRYTLARDFRAIRPGNASITLVEAGDRLLAGFSLPSSVYALRELKKLGVNVRIGEAVEEISDKSITIAGKKEPAGLVIWAAGVAASPLGKMTGAPTDKMGRVKINAVMEVEGLRDIYALGDVARQEDENGRPLPGLAQVAKQQGIHLGKGLVALIDHNAPLKPFRYRTRGDTAIIGRHAAIYEFGKFRLTGFLAWAGWAFIHVYLLVGFQHRTIVTLQWLWRYATYERGARLIIGPGDK